MLLLPTLSQAAEYNLPYKTLDAIKGDATGGGLRFCNGGLPVQNILIDKNGGDDYRVYATLDGSAIMILVFYQGQEGNADRIGLTSADEAGNLRPIVWLTLDEAVAQLPGGPCEYLSSPNKGRS